MYATLQDLIDRFGEREILLLTDRENTGQIMAGLVDRALSDGSAAIDGYLGGRYKLPLESVPVRLVRVCCDITRYYLYDDHPPEAVTQLYRDSMDWLRALAKGDVGLGLDGEGEAAVSEDLAQMESDGRVFGRKDSTGFI